MSCSQNRKDISSNFYYRSQTKMGQGNVFIAVCLSTWTYIPACTLARGLSQHALWQGVCIPACTWSGCVDKGMCVTGVRVDRGAYRWMCVDRRLCDKGVCGQEWATLPWTSGTPKEQGTPPLPPPPDQRHILFKLESTTKAGGTHPTGMHSCL